MTDNKKKKRIKIIIEIIAILLILAGIFVIILPKITDFLYKENVEKIKTVFVNETTDIKNESLLDKLYKQLQDKNNELYDTEQKDLKDAFSYEQAQINLEQYGLSDNIVGFIQIPKLNVELPILLGANKDNMLKGAVHLTETSYPIGGINTNSIIAAHRGYGKTEMFRNIHKLEIGDDVYIKNFRENLAYKVSEIKIIDPTDVDELKIQRGKDLITLVSCHPYRVNTKRYVVFCERV